MLTLLFIITICQIQFMIQNQKCFAYNLEFYVINLSNCYVLLITIPLIKLLNKSKEDIIFKKLTKTQNMGVCDRFLKTLN